MADAAQSPEMVSEMVNGDDERYEVQYVIPVYENWDTSQEQLIQSHSSARFCFELSGNSN